MISIAILIGLQILLQVFGYVVMGIGLRLGWHLGDRLMYFIRWANRKLK